MSELGQVILLVGDFAEPGQAAESWLNQGIANDYAILSAEVGEPLTTLCRSHTVAAILVKSDPQEALPSLVQAVHATLPEPRPPILAVGASDLSTAVQWQN